jgi:hypothetical protein
MNRKISLIAVLSVIALCSTAHADEQTDHAVVMSLGMAAGVELACGMDSKADIDLAGAYSRTVSTPDLDKAFVTAMGGGAGMIKTDHNFPGLCTDGTARDLIAKAQRARDYATHH